METRITLSASLSHKNKAQQGTGDWRLCSDLLHYLSGSSCGSWELDPVFDIISPHRELSLVKPHGLHSPLRHVVRVTQSEPRGVRVQVIRCIQTRLPSGQAKAVCQLSPAGAFYSMASQGQCEPSHHTVDCLTFKCSSEHSLCLLPSVSLVT